MVGPTGAGKTTLVNLLSRFYNVDSGRILIDGVDIAGVTIRSLRKQMGVMMQDSFISPAQSWITSATAISALQMKRSSGLQNGLRP